MKKFAEIVDVIGRQVIDSRGNPTVEVEVYVDDGVNTFMAVLRYRAVLLPVSLRHVSFATETRACTSVRACSRLLMQ